jgi:hypothetical protein
MNEFNALYTFIDLAQKNRKYPVNTAHGRRAALKLFETALHPDELESLDLIEERMKEIYLNLISKHRETFSIKSLNTYKGRFLKVIQDYKKYGIDPKAFGNWEAKPRTYKKKQAKDSNKDIVSSIVSHKTHSHVYKIKIAMGDGQDCSIELPSKPTKEDTSIITKIISALAD